MQPHLDILNFSGFSLDLRRRELLCGGKAVALHARALDVLAYLIEHREAAVSHADILEHVWQGRAVSDGNLAVQLSALRKALSEAGGGEKLIVTLPDRRYRFVGELAAPQPEPSDRVTPLDPAPEPPPPSLPPFLPPFLAPPKRSRRKIWQAAATVALLAGAVTVATLSLRSAPQAPRLSMAVLPFRNASADRSQDYLADGITDDLTADLAHIPASTVIARESAEAVKRELPQRIGHDLNVRYIVAGSVSPEEGHYHIVVSLIDAGTGRQLWTTQFDPARDRVSQVRPAIVRRIATTLNVAIDELEAAHTQGDRPDDANALDVFFRARSILDSGQTMQAFEHAHTLLRQAIAKQPDFADAQAELGWMLLRKATTLSDPDEVADLNEARQAIQTALVASPQNTKAMAAHAMEQYYKGDCAAAQQNATLALGLEPSSLNARSVLAACAQAEMRFDDAIREYEGILQLNPASPHNAVFYLIIGTLRLVQSHVAEATKYLTLARDNDAAPTADLEPAEQAALLLIAAHDLSGDQVKARAEYTTYAKKFRGRTVWRIGSYFDPAWHRMDGLNRALAALEDAGMPAFANEADPGIGFDAGAGCADGAFAPTPRWPPSGGRLLDTTEFAQAIQAVKAPLVIDVGLGIAIEPAWEIYNRGVAGETQVAFALRMAQQSGKLKQEGVHGLPIIVLGEGVMGCNAFRAAEELIRAGYDSVQWYRGGEEAWQKHRKP